MIIPITHISMFLLNLQQKQRRTYTVNKASTEQMSLSINRARVSLNHICHTRCSQLSIYNASNIT